MPSDDVRALAVELDAHFPLDAGAAVGQYLLLHCTALDRTEFAQALFHELTPEVKQQLATFLMHS
jgi:hypothetical protein